MTATGASKYARLVAILEREENRSKHRRYITVEIDGVVMYKAAVIAYKRLGKRFSTVPTELSLVFKTNAEVKRVARQLRVTNIGRT